MEFWRNKEESGLSETDKASVATARISSERDRKPPFKFTIRLTVVSIFVAATLLTAAVAVSLQYYFSRVMATEAVVSKFTGLASSSSQFLQTVDDRALQFAKMLSVYPNLVADKRANGGARDLFAQILRSNSMFYAIYLGFDNGDLYELVNLDSNPHVRSLMQASEKDRWVIITVFDVADNDGNTESRYRKYDYYDEAFQLRTSRQETSDYRSTNRPWFVQAEEGRVNKTDPYLFRNLQSPGQTYSTVVAGSDAVVAIDIALSTLSNYLYANRVNEEGEVYIYQKSGEIIASDVPARASMALPKSQVLSLSKEELATIKASPKLLVSNETNWAPIDFAISGQPYGYSIDYLSFISEMTGLQFEYVNGFSWSELLVRFNSGVLDVLQPVFLNSETETLGLFSDPFLQLPYSLVTMTGRDVISKMSELNGLTVAIPSGWSIITLIRQYYPDINVLEVASSRVVFEAVLSGQADAGMDTGRVLRFTAKQYFYQGLQYHDDVDFTPVNFPDELIFVFSEDSVMLRNVFNRAIANVSEKQKKALAGKWFDEQGAVFREPGTVPYSQLVSVAQDPKQLNRLQRVNVQGENYFLFVTPFGEGGRTDEYFSVMVPADQVLAPAIDKVKLSILFTAGLLLLLLPLPWIFSAPIVRPIKNLAAENEKIQRRAFDQLHIPHSHIKEIDDLGVSMMSMSESIQQHEAAQVALMDSFIQLIAQAIDDKSHYTAGHCERVPELAFMLAEKAELSQEPYFKDFRFSSSAQWREFRVAAWLHDCGKITTPEHIVDKGSKLETIYNRIHEVRTRFEVLWRDAEIQYWKKIVAHPEEEASYKQELQRQQETLKDDFTFVAAMNVGGEYLSEDKKRRLKTVAETTWVRHFSDRLGLSPLEETRVVGDPSTLPCEERLLMDKPEHIIAREHDTDYDPRLGIQMEVPEHLYDLGELHNLCVERGTLTAEDRFKINEHIISTIRMLDALPFPEELSNVPRYASTHHEAMNGTGYPRGLRGDQLSIPERIMVLADIFEALTAADRPYKKAKPVSVAIDIMAKMVVDEHIDAAVFELFLTSGVYLDYAQRFLPAEQIDTVDVQKYLVL